MSDEKPATLTHILEATKDGQLVQINYAEIKDQIADQVRAFLLNMMPKETIGQVCEIAWKNLTEPRPVVLDSYSQVKTPAKPSELEEMVTDIMRKKMMDSVAAWGQEWRTSPELMRETDTRMTQMIEHAAKTHLHAVGQSIISRAIESLPSPCNSCGQPASRNSSCSNCSQWNN